MTNAKPYRRHFSAFQRNGSNSVVGLSPERTKSPWVYVADAPTHPSGFLTTAVSGATHPAATSWRPDGHVPSYEHDVVHADEELLDGIRTR